MGKYTSTLLIAGLMSGGAGLYVSHTNVPSFQEYGDLKLIDSLDHGRMWPKQKAQMRHGILNTMKNRVASFPSAQEKQVKIQNIQARIEALEQQINGESI